MPDFRFNEKTVSRNKGLYTGAIRRKPNLTLIISSQKVGSSETIRGDTVIIKKKLLIYLLMNINIKISKLEDDWIVGLVDGDGCFTVSRSGTDCSFIVAQDADSKDMLYALKTHFGCGTVNVTSGHMMEYRVKVHAHLKDIIIPFFVKNPLQTEKINNFAKLYYVITGETYELPPERPLTKEWIIGFSDAESSFTVSMVPEGRSQANKIQLKYTIGQSEKRILERIADFIGFGNVTIRTPRKGNTYAGYEVASLDGHLAVINLFTTSNQRCLLKTYKRISFLLYKKCAIFMRDKKHLTPEGKRYIRNLIENKNERK